MSGPVWMPTAPSTRARLLRRGDPGWPYADAAARAGCPVGTVRSRVARARDDLAEAMRDTNVRRTAAG